MPCRSGLPWPVRREEEAEEEVIRCLRHLCSVDVKSESRGTGMMVVFHKHDLNWFYDTAACSRTDIWRMNSLGSYFYPPGHFHGVKNTMKNSSSFPFRSPRSHKRQGLCWHEEETRLLEKRTDNPGQVHMPLSRRRRRRPSCPL